MNNTKTKPEPLAPVTGSATVLDEYARLDRTIRDCEHSLLIAERLKARGHNVPESEVDAVRLKLSEAMIERDFMYEWMKRRAKSPNNQAQRPGTLSHTNATAADMPGSLQRRG